MSTSNQDNAFRQACHEARQQLTFCGVNAHFQNGIAERCIRDLSESARKQLLHARARWPQAVHFALWPYALRNAALLHNTLPVIEDGTSRLELFSSIHVGSNMKHVHTFGCPPLVARCSRCKTHLLQANLCQDGRLALALGSILGSAKHMQGMSTWSLT